MLRLILLSCLCLSTAAFASKSTLINLSDAPGDPMDSGTLWVRLKAIRPMPVAAGDVLVGFSIKEGKITETGHHASADYNQKSQNSVSDVAVEVKKSEGYWTASGTFTVTINGDMKRPNRPEMTFPKKPDVFKVTINELRGKIGEPAPFLKDTEYFMPPWRKDVPDFGGQVLTGSYSAQWDEATQSGAIFGALAPTVAPGKWGTYGNLWAERTEEGVKILARLAPERVMASSGSLTYRFPEPQDWTGYDAIALTVQAPERKNGVGIGLTLREASGSQFSVREAVPLRMEPTRVVVPFNRFLGGTGGNYFLDLDQIQQISFGINNPFGIGDVAATVLAAELVTFDQRPEIQTETTITVEPDLIHVTNGYDDIPKGIFGFHDVRGTVSFAERSAKHEKKRQRRIERGKEDIGPFKGTTDERIFSFMEATRPGMLRPLEHVGFNGSDRSDEELKANLADNLKEAHIEPTDFFYLRAKHGDAVDMVVQTHSTDLWSRPPWMNQGVAAVAEGTRKFYRDRAANAWQPGDDYNYRRYFEVWNEPFMWARHVNMEHQQPKGQKAWTDPTQYGYLPAKLITDAYSTIFNAAAEGGKSINPHIKFGGPSAPSFNADSYGIFRNHIKPFIDQAGPNIDFLTEHHYGGSRRSTSASYEVVTAYFKKVTGRTVPIFNTEVNDLGGDDLDKAHYQLEEILNLINVCPDKARGRSIHACWDGLFRAKGEEDAYTLMGPLRGKRIVAQSDHRDVLVAASHPEPGKMVLLAFNSSPQDQKLSLKGLDGLEIESYSLLTGDEGSQTEAGVADTEGQKINPVDGSTQLTNGTTPTETESGHIVLPSRAGLRITFSRDGFTPSMQMHIKQSYSDQTDVVLEPGQKLKASLINEVPDGAEKVWLRVVTSGVDEDELIAKIGTHEITLPWSTPNTTNAEVQDILLPEGVKPTDIHFVLSPEGNGACLLKASFLSQFHPVKK